jgi:uncharacterized protein YbcI
MEKIPNQNLHKLAQYTADFIKSKTGKGPRDIKSYWLENKVFIEMIDLLTPIELEIASTVDGTMNVKLARERFYDKYAEKYHSIAGEILGCHIKRGCVIWDISHDEAYIVLTVSDKAGVEQMA